MPAESSHGSHPTDRDLENFAREELGQEKSRRILDHCRECEPCADRLLEIVGEVEPAEDRPLQLSLWNKISLAILGLALLAMLALVIYALWR